MRKLASIQVVHDIQPIEGADFIERVSVMGWKCVAKKGEFEKYDKCVFFEIDSLLDPSNPAFAFMEKAKYRVKTIKLRGQISQGLALPVTILPEWARDKETGFDCTEVTKTIKWELPENTSRNGDVAGAFPGYVPVTDETRIQSCMAVLEELRGQRLFSTVKLDGTSSTFCNLDDEISVCSRKRSIKEDDENAYWRMARQYDILDILKYEKDIAIQGEIVGFWHKGRRSPIQNNRLGLTDTDLFVFNIYEIKEGRYYNFDEFIEFCEKYKLNTVPIENPDFVLDHSLDDLLEMSKGTYPNGHQREGLVFRTLVETQCKALKGRASFKCINNDFLLKVKE